jgi:hypothetical protein
MHAVRISRLIPAASLATVFRQKRIPGYVASSGFGLHSGWAIQGAIGTEFKIDAIYLSR